MKKNLLIMRFILALIAVTLAGLATRTSAAVFPAASYANTFQTGGNTSPFAGSGSVASWISWYDTPGNNSPLTNDVNTPDTGAGPGAGSLMVDCPFTNDNQNLFFGTFSNNAPYDFSQTISNLNQFDYIKFDVYVKPIDPNTGLIQQTNTDGNFGSLEVGVMSSIGPTPTFFGTVTIPGSATNGWVSLQMPINHAMGNLISIGGIAFNYNNYNGYPTNDFVFWIGHVVMHYNPTLVIGPPTLLGLQKPVVGLNMIDTQVTGNNDNRYQVETATSSGFGFVDKPNVTYSWNIKSFPTNSPFGYQQHFFIVNGTPGPYDQAADWNLADCIYITVQADSNNFAYMSFRYKTNEPAANGMIYNTATNNWPIEPVGYLYTSNYSPLGTWSVTFNNQTNVTLTAPHGQTTNFVFDPASAALFADPATVILGAQPNDTFVIGEAVVYNWFSVTGNDSPFTNIFTNDLQLNTNYWTVLANDPNGVVLVPPNAAYWLPWTLPDSGFGLQTNANLATTNTWNDAVPLQEIQNYTNRQALLGTNLLPSANQGYYRLLERNYTQLQILLPGETNAPNTVSGYVGTPNSVVNSTPVAVTVNACDNTFHIVNLSGDAISLSSGTASVPGGTGLLANGTYQTNVVWLSPTSGATVTATDTTQTNIAPATTAPPITVN